MFGYLWKYVHFRHSKRNLQVWPMLTRADTMRPITLQRRSRISIFTCELSEHHHLAEVEKLEPRHKACEGQA